MNKFLKTINFLLIFTMIQTFSVTKAFATEDKKTLTILFTHDMHDHFLPSKINKNGVVREVGGYGRLKTLIDEERKNSTNSILVDAGDFSMGTLFQTIYKSDSPELRTMGQIGYDVTTLGNHEFDFRPDGLTGSLRAAKDSGDKLPQIVQSNTDFCKDENGSMTDSIKSLKEAMDYYGVKDYTVLNRNGIKIGIFGLMGVEAASNAPMSEVKFTDAVENAKRVVKTLKEEEKVDIILCLSHSGTNKDKSKSEDEILAKKVPDIDVIISGHTHSTLNDPIIVGKTTIGSIGEYGENLGVIKISQDEKNSWKLDSYDAKGVDKNLNENPQILDAINKFKDVVENKYLSNFGMKFDEVIANTPFNFISTNEMEKEHKENTLGNLITDGYIYSIKQVEGENYDPIAVSIIPAGTIRGSFIKGNITVADIFNVNSLGIGDDKISGYPLASIYLTGKELKTTCEVDASISPIMSSAQLFMSGISFSFNPNRLIFNKVTEAKLQKEDGSFEEINDTKLYRVVSSLYSAQMLSIIKDQSFGLLSIVPKTKDGKTITNFEDYIIKYNSNGKETELKEWISLTNYLKSFDKVNGVPQITENYNILQGRKIVDDNHNVINLVSNPNKIALGVYGIAIVLISLMVLIILKIRKRIRISKESNEKQAL
ncbi:bifunctional metallophosphatase/5'-nucleotidase [Clostridium gasigenes]|uniref:bifunctional metallophosphatase/5'-nucleotidase n=1 Tax=Clostridium gasigenes TaxID=94869 RepID=UPI001C0B9CDA|nr:bifunctional UDP-sugar hydrolase/5'-nucleotidase [Clostridium gasigenes]MBU3137071.1 bifunctional metallophosphatase/5'-nucleotidase [Clostridium gasigenes]